MNNFFNLIQVTNKNDIKSLDHNQYSIQIPFFRFLEFSELEVRDYFYEVKNPNIAKKIQEFPTLITCVDLNDIIQLVKISSIMQDDKNLTVNYKILDEIILQNIGEITFNSLQQFLDEISPINETKKIIEKALQLSNKERHTVHFSIKKSNLFFIFNQYTFFDKFKKYENEFKSTQNINAIGECHSSFGESSTFELTTEHYVTTVSQFIKVVLDEIEEKNPDGLQEFFFRGHSKSTYKLQPSLFREFKSKGKIYEEDEHTLYRELITAEPDFFNKEPSAIDTLTRMQHYSMPTRLLDISSNPLTALYFAAEDPDNHYDLIEKTKISSLNPADFADEIIIKDSKVYEKKYSEGEVILLLIKKSSIKFFDSDTVTCLANLVKLNKNQKNHILNIINSPSISKIPSNDNVCNQYIHFIKNEKPYFKSQIIAQDLKKIVCIKAKKLDKRVQAQAGSFLLFGYESELPLTGNDDIKIIKFKIKYDDKETILKQLDLLGINKSTIYPDIENSAKYIKQKLERES